MKIFYYFWAATVVCGFFFFGALPAIASIEQPAHFSVTISPSPVHPGEVADVIIKAAIDPGWHLYSLVAVAPPGPSATTISLTGDGATLAGAITEDPPIQKVDPNFGKQVAFHQNSAVFHVPTRVALSANGNVALTLSVNYQTCNDRICLPPRTEELPVTLMVTPGPVRALYREAKQSFTPDGNIGLFLAAAFGAGLLALLTPCVFPLIPITLSSFVKQADGDKRRLVEISLAYSLGIVLLYVVVGGLTTAILGASGISRLATNPWVNLFAFVVFLMFALSFFETIRLELPGDLGALQQVARKQTGWVSLAALGTVFVLASFTCTAPFVGTLLVTAAGGSLLRPLLGMLVFSIAFVSPFVLLSIFPHWIAKVPKSGLWLARFKATLGFIEIAAALKFLSNADLIWQWHLLTQPVLLAAWALLFALTALYLIGTLRFGIVAATESAGAKVTLWRGFIASCFAMAAGYCFWGLAGRPLIPIVLAFLPPASYGSSTPDSPAGLVWSDDYDASIASSKLSSKRVFVDFTGYTCTNCRLNENQVFPDPAVKKELQKFNLVELYTDGGPDAARNEQLEITKFGDAALPLYAVVDPATETVVAKTAGVQSIGGFRTFLTNAEGGKAPTSTEWATYSDRAVAMAGKPVIIDFTASWCTNCKAIERSVFPDPTVTKQLANFATFRCDMTDYYSPANAALQKKYGIISLPVIVFLDPAGHEYPNTRVTGLITVAGFLAKIHSALLG